MKIAPFLSVLLFFFGIATLHADDTIVVSRLLGSTSMVVQAPFQTDTMNLSGSKSDFSYLLKSVAVKGNSHHLLTSIEASANGDFPLTKQSESEMVAIYKFYLTANEFCKPTLEVTSSAGFELLLNGKSELSKMQTEDSIKSTSPKTISFTCEPKTYEVVIKTLTSHNQKDTPTLKVRLFAPNREAIHISTENVRHLSINHILEGTRPTAARVSPNGQFALIRYTTVYSEKGNSSSFSQLIDLKTKKVLLTDYNERDNLAWMPRCNKLFFSKKGANGDRQLITLDPVTLAETVIDENLPDGHFNWSPSEDYLIFSKYEYGKAESGDFRRYLTPADRQSNYRNRYFLHRYDLTTGLLSPLTFGLKSSVIQHISHDGRYLLLSQSDETLTSWPLSVNSFFCVDMNTMHVDTLLLKVAHVSSGQFLPDNKTIVFMGTGEAFNGIGKVISADSVCNIYNTEAYLMDITTKEVKPITRSFDPSIQGVTFNLTNPALIYFTTADRDYVNVYSYNTKTNQFTKLPLGVEVVSSFDPAEHANVAIYYGQSASSPAKVFVCDLARNQSTLLAFPQEASYNEYRLGEVKEYNFTSNDGITIYGRYYLPPNFDSSKQYPMIVYYYGGTTPVERLFESRYPLHLYASMGYVVYNPQPSGAIGFGQSFAARHVNAWGIRTADEIIEGTKKFCTDHSFINPRKIGCIGASYGGFMTQYLLTRTDIFAAAVSHAGISDISSYWGEGYWGYAYNAAAAAKSYPWNNPDLYTKQSPLTSADKVSAPLLLLHGGDDTNVPIGESVQMFTALKLLGKEVAFIEVKGENHAIVNYDRRIRWNNSIFAWFAKWLQEKDAWWNELYPKVDL